MIDIETTVYGVVSTALRAAFPGIAVYGDDVSTSAVFPCVSLVETDDYTIPTMQTTNPREQYAAKVYTANVYSNLASGRKAQCKAIMDVIDQSMQGMYFEKTMNQPMSNINDTIARRIARWQCRVRIEPIDGQEATTARVYRR